MKRPYLPTLNITLNTTFDFTDAKWSGHDYGRELVMTVEVGEEKGTSSLDKRAWSLLTTKGHELAFQAAIIHAASNLIDKHIHRNDSER